MTESWVAVKLPFFNAPREDTVSPTLMSASVMLSRCFWKDVFSSTVMVCVFLSGRSTVSVRSLMAMILPAVQVFPVKVTGALKAFPKLSDNRRFQDPGER